MKTEHLARWALAALIISVTSACHRGEQSNDEGVPSTPKNPGEDLGLTVPEADFAKSKYCGDVRPPIPENPTPPYSFSKELLNEKLASESGLQGWIHGAVHPYKQYVFTYRKEDPDDFMAFFKAEQFSLIGATSDVWATLATLNRHDKVRLKGQVFENGSPVKHLFVKSIELVKKYDKPVKNEYPFDLNSLASVETFNVLGQVHATVHSEQHGDAVILERDHLILPVAIPATYSETAKALYKGDILSVDVRVMKSPNRPPHFVVDTGSKTGISIVDPLLNCHNVQKTVTGHLVKFEQSPAISTDVYAVRIVDGNGIARNMTFFPDAEMDDEAFGEIFMAISAKAKTAWEQAQEVPHVVRNFNEKKSIRVIARGKINVVSTEQANAQVYLKSADDLEFKVE